MPGKAISPSRLRTARDEALVRTRREEKPPALDSGSNERYRRSVLGARIGLAMLLSSCATAQPEPRASGDTQARCASLKLKRSTTPGEPDADHDCLPDAIDRCIDAAEDHDFFEDDDGCPDPDNDRDGALDVADMCPDVVGVASENGCPAK
jgi:hypothetical protein